MAANITLINAVRENENARSEQRRFSVAPVNYDQQIYLSLFREMLSMIYIIDLNLNPHSVNWKLIRKDQVYAIWILLRMN